MLRKVVPVVFACLCTLAMRKDALATPIAAGNYYLSGASATAGSTAYTLTGTVTVGSNGLLNSAAITLNDSALGNPVFTVVGQEGTTGYAPVSEFAYLTPSNNAGQLYLSYNLDASQSSGMTSLCTLSAGNCNSYQASYLQIYNASSFGYGLVALNGGSLEALPASRTVSTAAATPEPGSFVLLASGLVGMAAFFGRQRLRRGRD